MTPKNLVEMLYQTTQRFPEKRAIMWKEKGKYQSCTYRELWNTVLCFAEGLRQMGIGRGSKVAVFSENGPRWLISDFAILSLGAVTVPIYPTLAANQVSFILENADVELAIVQTPQMVKRLKGWPKQVRHIILLENKPVKHPIVVPFEQVVQDTVPNRKPAEWETLDPGDLATIVHTSGTTGNPKGVMLSHGNILSNIIGSLYYLPVTHHDLSLSFLPVSHIFERTCGHFTPMYAGGTIAYAENLTTVPQNILEVKPTLITSVPRLYEKIYGQIMQQIKSGSLLKLRMFNWALQAAKNRKAYTDKGYGTRVPFWTEIRYLIAQHLVFSKIISKLGGQLRLMVSGGAALDPKVSHFFSTIGLPILEGYGMTECSPVISTNPVTRYKPGTVGLPLPGTKVQLAEDGELMVKSLSVMMGYYKQPEETEKTLENGWLRTGDIADMDEDGFIRIIDRKKNILVLSTGKNVAPQPVENMLCSSPYISRAVLIGHRRKYVSALIVPDYDAILQTAHQRGWKAGDKDSLARAIETRQLIQEEIERLLVDFSPFEKPKKFAVLQDEFSIEKGELTPTLKVRLKEVEKNYASVIAELYEETAEEEVAAAATVPVKYHSSQMSAEIQNSLPSTSIDSSRKTKKKPPLWLNPQLWLGIILGILTGLFVRYFIF
ncbi:AMP-dependent synthetase/ligase [Paenactinomyces guangxiensis]|uniref:Long-chain fatty acid--CoA ligase n=1 Tax=Paenactinomyces guangxiensis TaxID=1490290 RepID=A0A7W1WR94_9BACL|nr:long-chain fatty acid--CoA ligase [Paenactinomyces guangxiensis]MBA4494503.1 long-chain fatty acid--CoA ligase [Paenactinomyces guangxiensis]MBH8591442.1 long-chain fatty acid--CoA ligase [Paenactinomyces guangxiensis]